MRILAKIMQRVLTNCCAYKGDIGVACAEGLFGDVRGPDSYYTGPRREAFRSDSRREQYGGLARRLPAAERGVKAHNMVGDLHILIMLLSPSLRSFRC